MMLFVVVALVGCDKAFQIDIDPIEVQACFDGADFSRIQEYCIGTQPLDPLNPQPGEFNKAECDKIQVSLSCDKPETQALGILTTDGQP
jgi:ribosomal protein L11 methylase PrmA